MKHSLAVKFAAVLLAAFSLLAACASGAGIVMMESAELYVKGLDDLQDREYKSISSSIANSYVELYAANHLGNLPYTLKRILFADPADRGDTEYWRIKLQEGDAVLVDPGNTAGYPIVREYTIQPQYPIIVSTPDNDKNPEQTDPNGATEPTVPEEELVPPGFLYKETVRVWENDWWVAHNLYYYEAPEYRVTVYMQEGVLESSALHILTSIYPYRYSCIALLVGGLIGFAVCLVYLLWSAGVTPSGELRPGGLNRIPLDLYTLVVAVGIFLLARLFSFLWTWTNYEGPHVGNLSLLGVNVLAMILLGMGLILAYAAQIRMKSGYGWKHTALRWLGLRLKKLLSWVWRGIRGLMALLPVIWQWLLVALVLIGSALALVLTGAYRQNVLFAVLLAVNILFGVAAVLYSGGAYGILLQGIRRMVEGELSYQIPTKHLYGSFRQFALELNSLSRTATVAAEKEMKAERMRSELITNVSHDIKTPLTSIINFVDLLQKPHSEEQSRQYLEVLQRQSERMKKLIEDLMELSRASSGNITVNPVRLDAAESVNQAVGEFSDKLEKAALETVVNLPAEPVYILADGRLTWRVLSNLLSNAVKYAQPGTRVYIDLQPEDTGAQVSVKNVSRELLNISSEELLERFVRGDVSRNSEGSGLGLNIAKSLMEVQGGALELQLDGDLFKVTLHFPAGGREA